jgi:hypothetical protein
MATFLNNLFLYSLDAARLAIPSSSSWSALAARAANILRLSGEILIFVWMFIAVAFALLVAAGFLV